MIGIYLSFSHKEKELRVLDRERRVSFVNVNSTLMSKHRIRLVIFS